MTEAVELRNLAEKAVRDFEKYYDEALEAIRRLKEKINTLELSISHKEGVSVEDMRELDSSIEKLDALVDSLILRSAAEWETYQRLGQEYRAHALDPAGLDSLRIACKKTEGLAKDMLCYSLGHLKRKAPIPAP